MSKKLYLNISVAFVTRAFVFIDSSSRIREMFSIMLSSILFIKSSHLLGTHLRAIFLLTPLL